ncbi:MAG: response regulator [Bacteroidota bacterium]|jgi:DNA-binding NtrC family response regulator
MLPTRTILLIDDEFIILESLRIQLSRILDDSINLEVASSGEESYALIDEFHTSGVELLLIISDFNLGDSKGTEVLNYAHQKFPNSKKVILSGQSDIKMIDEFEKNIGLHDRISKPWEFHDLKISIERALSV